MEIRSDGVHQQLRSEKQLPHTHVNIPKTRLKVWFITVCSSILIWTCLVQVVAVGGLWQPHFLFGLSNFVGFNKVPAAEVPWPPQLVPARNYISNGFLKISCNGGLNQMRAEICDMVTVARLLNLTLVVPELDKASFWADLSGFEDIFDASHFINSLRDEVKIVRRLPKKLSRKYKSEALQMPPVSWSTEKYYLEQILPLFSKYMVIHFNRTDTRLANNGIPVDLQKLRCRVNFQALKFTTQIDTLGHKLIQLLQAKGPFVALHLRYEMDMLAFSGCTHGCTVEEADELKRLRYAFPWWREKEIMSEEKRSQGHCPLTPEEAALVLTALGFDKDTQIYIASGEIYGGRRRLAALRTAFPQTIKKEMLLDHEELRQFQNHSSQMAAIDFMVSVASNTFVPTYDGNMARVVEGHRRYLGFKNTIQLDRRKLVELLDLHLNGTISWDDFSGRVRLAHEKKKGLPAHRIVIADKPKEEDYFYANPEECLCENLSCDDLLGTNYSTAIG